MIYILFKINISRKEIYFIILILFLIELLVKENFCDILGYFISKLVWIILIDDEIFNCFD